MINGEKSLIILDSNSIIHRAFHALPSLATKNGEVLGAVYGFLLVFFRAIKEFQPEGIAACFDFPGPTLRHKKFKEYKAKRPPLAEELKQQIPKVKEVLRVFNVPVFEKEGFEADDLIGTIAKKAAGIKKIIVSGDLDNLQLIDDSTKVYILRKGVKDIILYDEKLFKEKFQGLIPEQLVDFKSLRGDSSDNIPGVPGIGEKTAFELIKKFGSLEKLYESLTDVNKTLRVKLGEQKEKAFLSKDLAKIKKDAPIIFNLEECQWGDYDKSKAAEFLKDFEFYSLLKKMPELEKREMVNNLRLW